MASPELKFDTNTELAARRTGMSFQRTRMSADRTLMSVIRTALSLIGFGFTIFQVFQKLHDALMAGTPNIDQEVVRAAAQRVGLDWDRLQRDMADPAIQARLDANLKMAHALQIEGTPAYVIGDRMLSGAVELAELQDAVTAARRK